MQDIKDDGEVYIEDEVLILESVSRAAELHIPLVPIVMEAEGPDEILYAIKRALLGIRMQALLEEVMGEGDPDAVEVIRYLDDFFQRWSEQPAA